MQINHNSYNQCKCFINMMHKVTDMISGSGEVIVHCDSVVVILPGQGHSDDRLTLSVSRLVVVM